MHIEISTQSRIWKLSGAVGHKGYTMLYALRYIFKYTANGLILCNIQLTLFYCSCKVHCIFVCIVHVHVLVLDLLALVCGKVTSVANRYCFSKGANHCTDPC